VNADGRPPEAGSGAGIDDLCGLAGRRRVSGVVVPCLRGPTPPGVVSAAKHEVQDGLGQDLDDDLATFSGAPRAVGDVHVGSHLALSTK
jgi:hypothetical protein